MFSGIRVLQIGMTPFLGGIESYLYQQYIHLDRSRVRYDFVNITGENKMCYTDEIQSRGDVVYNVVSRHLSPLKHYFQIAKILIQNKNRYDAVVLNANHLRYIFPILISKIVGIPVRVVHSHNAGDNRKCSFLVSAIIEFNKFIMNNMATDFWACSKVAGNWMFEKDKPFKVIHNAVDLNALSYKPAIRKVVREKLGLDDKIIFANIGRVVPQKNHIRLIEIYNDIQQTVNNSVLLLIGDNTFDKSYVEQVSSKINELGLSDKIIFLGQRSDAHDLMQAVDCILMPSLYEGLSVLLVEAQAMNVPCIVSDTVSRETDLSKNIIFVNNKDSNAWKEASTFFLSKKDRNSNNDSLKNNGYDIACETERVMELLEKGVTNNNG